MLSDDPSSIGFKEDDLSVYKNNLSGVYLKE